MILWKSLVLDEWVGGKVILRTTDRSQENEIRIKTLKMKSLKIESKTKYLNNGHRTGLWKVVWPNVEGSVKNSENISEYNHL